MRWFVFLAFGGMVAAGTSAPAASRCDRLLGQLGHQIADASCADSADLTTNNPATTPADNSLPGLPPFAFTPQTDRSVISPSPPNGSGTGTYSYVDRLSASDVGADVAAIATTGNNGKPLITVAGTMDALLPINLNARAYERAVTAALSGGDQEGRGHEGDDKKLHPAYRLYEVQNGNHIETYKDTFPQLELIQPHAQHAFDLLSDSIEHGSALPPDQCIPRGGSIAASPTQPGHCAQLFVGP
jgi:hypothetical protein